MDKTREEFEKWVDSQFVKELIGLGKDDKGVYLDLYANFMELAFAAAKELYAPKWISVEERLPAMVNTQDDECYSDYVLALLDDGEQILATAYPDGTWSDEYDTLYEQVIKWMELPK